MVPSLEGDEKLRRDKMLDWLDEVKWKPIVSPRAGGGLDLMLKNHCCTQTRNVKSFLKDLLWTELSKVLKLHCHLSLQNGHCEI